MRVLHLTTNDFGGAGKAVVRIHESLIKIGVESTLVVKNKANSTTTSIAFSSVAPSSILKRIWFSIKNRIATKSKFHPEYDYHNSDSSTTGVSTKNLIRLGGGFDVIILYWVTGFLGPKDISRLINEFQGKVFWYFLDMAPMTGGCHYTMGCSGYQEICSKCPAISKGDSNVSRNRMRDKLKYFSGKQLLPIVGSKQLQTQMKSSRVFKSNDFKQLYLGVDSKVFGTLDQSVARRALGLNILPKRKVLMVGALWIENRRKGFKEMQEILKHLLIERDGDDIEIVKVGNGKFHDCGFRVHDLGFVMDDRLLALAYQASDIFISSSIDDSGPMMINESLMCGTPIVSFDIGISQDIKGKGVGEVVENFDTKEFARAIIKLLDCDSATAKKLRTSCNHFAITNFSATGNAKKLMQILN